MVPVTSFYAALGALLVVALAIQVVRQRRRARVGIGDGGDPALARAIRAHANTVEYLPLALVLLLVAELGGAPSALLHGFGATLVVGRIVYALGLLRTAGTSFGRFAGTLSTWLVVVGLAGWLLMRAVY